MIPNIALKTCACQLTPALSIILQTFLDSGKLHRDWKDAFISHVFKKGEVHLTKNCRPVYLTCVTHIESYYISYSSMASLVASTNGSRNSSQTYESCCGRSWFETFYSRLRCTVPHAFVPCPLLFFCHINDLRDSFKSSACLCADDCYSLAQPEIVGTMIVWTTHDEYATTPKKC